VKYKAIMGEELSKDYIFRNYGIKNHKR